MRRNFARPYGGSTSGMRLMSMFMAILVLSMLYSRLREPAMWRGFADAKDTPAVKISDPIPENIVPGPNDLDKDEVDEAQGLFEFVHDVAPLKVVEMRAYWRLMEWSHTQPFAELESRAPDNILLTKIWEQPEKYRGTLMRLRIHVRQNVRWEAKDAPLGISQVCEVSGPTDESAANPYIVVFPDLPELAEGKDLESEIVFVGYFLKIMIYTARDGKTRKAPLLIGRARMISTPKNLKQADLDPWVIVAFVAIGIALVAYSVWVAIRTRKKSKVNMLPKEMSAIALPDEFAFESPFEHIDGAPIAPVVQTIKKNADSPSG